LAGGLPNAGYFPFETVEGDALFPNAFLSNKRYSFTWIWSLVGWQSDKAKTFRVRVPKFVGNPEDPNLATGLQYGTGRGIPSLEKFVNRFSREVLHPAFPEFSTFVHAGNTAGNYNAFKLLINPGEGFFAEEWTYTSVKAMAEAQGYCPIPVAADHQGMRIDVFHHLLSTWDEKARMMKRPRVLYTVPVGENPTGTNLSYARKKAVYELCVKYDIIIVEDDPYYFLQEGDYIPRHVRRDASKGFAMSEANAAFLSSLVPSFTRLDSQGRVLRLDTFSKSIAPGSRLGWFTGHPVFLERLERFAESVTQAPCGFSQTLISQLIAKEWGLDGYITWLRGLRQNYASRRDALVDLFVEKLDLTREIASDAGPPIYVGWIKDKKYGGYVEKKRPLLSLSPPAAGMFIWFRVHVEELKGLDRSGDPELDTPEKRLWDKFAKAGVLLAPGYFFAADGNDERIKTEANFRISFSNVDCGQMKMAVETIGAVLEELQV